MRAALLLLVLGCQAPSAEAPGATCAPAATSARARVAEVADQNRACTADADCVRVQAHTTCFHACDLPVNLVGKGAVERAAILVEAHECRTFRDAGCTLAEVACPATPAAVCRAGRCE